MVHTRGTPAQPAVHYVDVSLVKSTAPWASYFILIPNEKPAGIGGMVVHLQAMQSKPKFQIIRGFWLGICGFCMGTWKLWYGLRWAPVPACGFHRIDPGSAEHLSSLHAVYWAFHFQVSFYHQYNLESNTQPMRYTFIPRLHSTWPPKCPVQISTVIRVQRLLFSSQAILAGISDIPGFMLCASKTFFGRSNILPGAAKSGGTGHDTVQYLAGSDVGGYSPPSSPLCAQKNLSLYRISAWGLKNR